jgi:hypothetical protein
MIIYCCHAIKLEGVHRTVVPQPCVEQIRHNIIPAFATSDYGNQQETSFIGVWDPGQDSKQTPTEYKSEALPSEPISSVASVKH